MLRDILNRVSLFRFLSITGTDSKGEIEQTVSYSIHVLKNFCLYTVDKVIYIQFTHIIRRNTDYFGLAFV